jgi:hypothetical protein
MNYMTLQWAGHTTGIRSMDSEFWCRNPLGNYPLGMPRRRWEDNIRK